MIAPSKVYKPRTKIYLSPWYKLLFILQIFYEFMISIYTSRQWDNTITLLSSIYNKFKYYFKLLFVINFINCEFWELDIYCL